MFINVHLEFFLIRDTLYDHLIYHYSYNLKASGGKYQMWYGMLNLLLKYVYCVIILWQVLFLHINLVALHQYLSKVLNLN